MAPGAARCPPLIWAPSKAGPVGLEAASSRRRSPSTISAFVPTSTSSVIRVGVLRLLGQDHAGRIGADVAGDARQDVDASARVRPDAEFRRRRLDRPVRRQRERRTAEGRRVDAEQEVMHDRVADEGEFEDRRFA